MRASQRTDAAADGQRQERQSGVAAVFLSHKLVKGNRVLIGVGIHRAGGQKYIRNSVASHVSSGGMGEAGEECEIFAMRFKRCGRFVELEIFAFALGEPVPVGVVRIFLRRQGDAVGEKHAGQALGRGNGPLRGGGHGLQKWQAKSDAADAAEGVASGKVPGFFHVQKSYLVRNAGCVTNSVIRLLGRNSLAIKLSVSCSMSASSEYSNCRPRA